MSMPHSLNCSNLLVVSGLGAIGNYTVGKRKAGVSNNQMIFGSLCGKLFKTNLCKHKSHSLNCSNLLVVSGLGAIGNYIVV